MTSELKIGREYQWVGPTTTVPMGKLMAVSPNGVHQWSTGTLTTFDVRFEEIKKPGFLAGMVRK